MAYISGAPLILTKAGKEVYGDEWVAGFGEPWVCPTCEADTYQGMPRTCGACGLVAPTPADDTPNG